MKNVQTEMVCRDTGALATFVEVGDGPTRLARLLGTYDIEADTVPFEGGHR